MWWLMLALAVLPKYVQPVPVTGSRGSDDKTCLTQSRAPMCRGGTGRAARP